MAESDSIAMALISETWRSAGLTPPTPQAIASHL
jgi:hypothetical protein